MTSLAIALWMHLLGPTPSGCVPPINAVTERLPFPVPTVRLIQPVHPPKNVKPWTPKKDR